MDRYDVETLARGRGRPGDALSVRPRRPLKAKTPNDSRVSARANPIFRPCRGVVRTPC